MNRNVKVKKGAMRYNEEWKRRMHDGNVETKTWGERKGGG